METTYWCRLLVLIAFLAELSSVTSLPWRSPPKWKLPPLPDKRESTETDNQEALRTSLLSRVRHLEEVVQRRLDDVKLAKVRALEDAIRHKLADRGQQQQQVEEPVVMGGGAVDHAARPQQEQALEETRAHARTQEYNPMPKLKQISKDLVDLIEEIDRHSRR